jgi:hypothetical protein
MSFPNMKDMLDYWNNAVVEKEEGAVDPLELKAGMPVILKTWDEIKEEKEVSIDPIYGKYVKVGRHEYVHEFTLKPFESRTVNIEDISIEENEVCIHYKVSSYGIVIYRANTVVNWPATRELHESINSYKTSSPSKKEEEKGFMNTRPGMYQVYNGPRIGEIRLGIKKED